MKLIEQPWEKRNLNLSTVEYKFEICDEANNISDSVLNNEFYDYQICRVPSGKMDLVYRLQENGFKFSEMNYQLSASLKKLELNSLQNRIINELSYHSSNANEIELVFECIYSGVFDTDRIILDPYFKKEQSGIRFANWAKQEIEARTSEIFIVENNGNKLGFFILKHVNDKISYSLLAALFDDHELGLGFSTIYFPMFESKKEGKKKITTGVSSNNLNSLKIHLEMGYQITSADYLLIKHIR